MFNIIDRYIAREVISACLLVLLLLAALRSLFSLIDELGDINDTHYQLADAFLYVALLVPTRIVEFFPMSVLIGALFALGSMASNSEITVLRASGMTSWQIAGSTIKASIILVLIVIFLSEWVAPASTKAAQQLRTLATSGGSLTISKTGLWAKQKNEMIQVGRILTDGQLESVTIYQLSTDNRLEQIIKAQRASQQNQQWILQDVTVTRFTEQKIEVINESDRIWLNPLNNSQIETLSLEPDALNLLGLTHYIDYLKSNGLDAKPYQLVFWRKLLQPLAIAIMVFLATSFVFGPMRDVSMGARILSGVMLGFVFHLAVQSFGPLSLVFNVWPFIGAAIPLLLFAVLAYSLMRKNA